jgi:mutator protein MutT
MRQTTICLLIKDDQILLAMKKRGHGAGKWNGVGGKAEEGESIEQAATREAQEEIGVTPTNLAKVATVTFNFPPEHPFSHTSTIFLCDKWEGEPTESDEMKPEWFPKSQIPYDEMWESDRRWLPKVLNGQKLTVTVTSTLDNEMAEYTEEPPA